MRTLQSRFLVLAVVSLLALALVAPAAAGSNLHDGAVAARPEQAHQEEPPKDEAGSTYEVEPMLIWSTVALVVGLTLLSVLYLLKRKVGGFPENPAWVAPITIMPSRNFADEGTFGEASVDHHGTEAAHH